MRIDNAAFAPAGALVLVSVVLTWLVTPYALLLAAFVCVNMLRSGIIGLCPPAAAFRTFVLKPGCACNAPVLSRLPCTLGSGLSDLWGSGRW